MEALPTTAIITTKDDDKLAVLWVRAFEAWIRTYKSDSTVRAYRDSWKLFLAFAQLPPWKIGRSIVVNFVADMRERGLTDSTVQLRLAAISSFYDFTCRDYTVINDAGREVPLYDLNPANSRKLRRRIKPYTKSNYLSKEEIKQFFGAMDRSTVQGARDYALFLAYILTGRRNSEVRKVKDSFEAQDRRNDRGCVKVPRPRELCNNVCLYPRPGGSERSQLVQG